MIDMQKKVRFAEEASYEFRESVEWYESVFNGLGLRFTDEVDIDFHINNFTALSVGDIL
jgi:hypothetical protein